MAGLARTVERGSDGSVTAYDEVSVEGDRVERLLTELFTKHWEDVFVGPVIEGAAYEIRFTAPPVLSMLDGYLTVDLGPWHFHLCVGDHRRARPPRRRDCGGSRAPRSFTPTVAPACRAPGGCGSGTVTGSR
jgi:hypothetical protein